MTNPSGSSTRGDYPLDLVAAFVRRADFLLGLAALGSLVGIGVTFLISPHYVATVQFMPESDTDTPTMPFGGVASIASRLGVGNIGSGNPAEFYVQVVRTRTLLDPIVLRKYRWPTDQITDSTPLVHVLEVTKHYEFSRRLELASKALNERLDVDLDQGSGIVSLSVDMPDPDLAVAVLDAFLAQLDSFNLFTRQSRAKNRREFLEGRVREARAQLDSIESALEHFYTVNRTFASSPSLSFEEARLKRSLSMSQDVYVTLSQQLEQARIDAVRDTPTLTVVQHPIPPTKPKWPRKSAMAVLGALTGLIVAAVRTAWRDVLPLSSPLRPPMRSVVSAVQELWQRWWSRLHRRTRP